MNSMKIVTRIWHWFKWLRIVLENKARWTDYRWIERNIFYSIFNTSFIIKRYQTNWTNIIPPKARRINFHGFSTVFGFVPTPITPHIDFTISGDEVDFANRAHRRSHIMIFESLGGMRFLWIYYMCVYLPL